jgi:hypothetical protein
MSTFFIGAFGRLRSVDLKSEKVKEGSRGSGPRCARWILSFNVGITDSMHGAVFFN